MDCFDLGCNDAGRTERLYPPLTTRPTHPQNTQPNERRKGENNTENKIETHKIAFLFIVQRRTDVHVEGRLVAPLQLAAHWGASLLPSRFPSPSLHSPTCLAERQYLSWIRLFVCRSLPLQP